MAELNKSYDPRRVEDRIYRYWLEHNFERECTDSLLEEMKNEPSYMYKVSWRSRHDGENNLYQMQKK